MKDMSRIKEDLKLLPHKPGSYQMYNENDQIIYVGKAKDLYNRVNSYFIGSHDTKTTKMVSEIAYFKYIITNTEAEALILENNLIKENRPHYNILLMDDKTYPYIILTNEQHPRIFYTRELKKYKKKAKIFGPYPNALACKDTVEILNKLYPFRKCNQIPKKSCIYYDMHQCLAPCINKVASCDYDSYKKEVTSILNGNSVVLTDLLKQKMEEASLNLDFEQAKEYRDLLYSVTNATKNIQKIDVMVDKPIDVLGYFIQNETICINMFHLRSGNIIKRSGEVFDINSDVDDLLLTYLFQFYQKMDIIKPDILLIPYIDNYQIIEELFKIKVMVPIKGDKKKLVALASANAKESLSTLEKKKTLQVEKTTKPLYELAELLHIEYPKVIELFDNSNILGTDAVSGMVVYVDGVKSVKDYRKYKIKTVVGADDYHTMMEVLTRRYTRVMKDNLRKPNLLIVDGGMPQVKAAKEIVQKIGIDLNIMGLVKDDKHHTRAIVNSNLEEITIDKHSNLFLLLESMQDEVHRYAITYFKKTHTKTTFESKLDTIKGIGKNRKLMLFNEFASIEEIKNASEEKLLSLGLPKIIIKELKENL